MGCEAPSDSIASWCGGEHALFAFPTCDLPADDPLIQDGVPSGGEDLHPVVQRLFS